MIIKMYTFVSNAAFHREKDSRPDEKKHPNSILETVSLSTEDTRPFKSTKILNEQTGSSFCETGSETAPQMTVGGIVSNSGCCKHSAILLGKYIWLKSSPRL